MRTLVLAIALSLPVAFAQEHGAQGGHGAAAEHGGGHADLQMWKWINFALLAGLIGWAAAKNAGPFFRGRTEEIRKSIDDAAKFRAESEARAAEIQKRIGNLSQEIAQMRSNAKSEMDAEGARIKADTGTTVARMREAANNEIAAAGKQAREELKTHAAKLSLELAEAKVKARLDGGQQSALIEGFLAKLSRTTNN